MGESKIYFSDYQPSDLFIENIIIGSLNTISNLAIDGKMYF